MTTKLVSIQNAGEHGIIRDVDPILLPPTAWTNGNNIRFYNNEVQKILGDDEIQTPTLTDVQFVMPATFWDTGDDTKVWIYAGLDDVYYTDDGITETKITRQTTGVDVDYTGTSLDRWQGCVNQNLTILNNGVDSPQIFKQNATKLTNLKWDADDSWDDAEWLTRVMRSHKNFLFALQLDKGDGSGMNPNSVAWSEPAEPWQEPTTWDQSDTSSIAGQIELSSTEGKIVDGLSLRDNFIIYKTNSIYNLGYIGGQYVWQSREISNSIGLFAQGAVVQFLGQHVFMSNDDVLVTDGNQFKSVASQKVRNIIFTDIDTLYFTKTFAVANYIQEEVWFCYPTTNSTYINKAAIWNYNTGVWSFKDLPNVNYINSGMLFAVTAGDEWDDKANTWNSDSNTWGGNSFSQVLFTMLGATNTSIRQFNTGYTSNGTSYDSYVERSFLKLGDSNTIKRITAIYPKASGNMDIYVGSAMHQNDSFAWEGPYNITPEEDAQIRCRVTGRYHAIRFEFKGNSAHTLQGYDIEYVDTGYGR